VTLQNRLPLWRRDGVSSACLSIQPQESEMSSLWGETSPSRPPPFSLHSGYSSMVVRICENGLALASIAKIPQR
jgi:hypothetical protein